MIARKEWEFIPGGPHSASAGEKYSGTWRKDRRDGFGIYEWPDGDRYEGPWKDDASTGRPTPKMFARARMHGEIAAAVGRPGVKVCCEMTVGIATRDWVRGIVTAVDGDTISVRMDDPGLFEHVILNHPVRKSKIVQDALQNRTPAFEFCPIPTPNPPVEGEGDS